MHFQDEIMFLGQNVRRIRQSSGLSQKEMAKKLGIGVESLSMLEKGILPERLSCDIFARIKAAFGVGPMQMFLPPEE